MKVLVTFRSMTLGHVLVVGWVVFIVFFTSIESHYKGVVRIEKMAVHPNLGASDFGKSYHICVIPYNARRIGLMPVGLGKLP